MQQEKVCKRHAIAQAKNAWALLGSDSTQYRPFGLKSSLNHLKKKPLPTGEADIGKADISEADTGEAGASQSTTRSFV